ncbi:guanine deaminase [Aliiglaciecola sp. LCG003]|uniref:guanine deaminase n=1 Tax=Aliiglaciecola sp. LCG003 TaxID=3053655 RepID=UPI002573C504|nr:guanine deaminase [Aliiglaciecola sp. LCG003]WJG11213.1 guanine deaminase [Aliiglaciecola sp. LCG003]
MQFEFQFYRASILHFPKNTSQPDDNFNYFKDGLLVTHNGLVKDIGHFQQLKQDYVIENLHDYSGKLLIPGLIDSHLHFPQTEMIASYGEQLLEWLQNYTFPTEDKFQHPEYAALIAETFLDQLLSNGTTTAMVYSTVHKQATDALFSAAQQRNMCLIAGKVCMDRNCPEPLRDTPLSAQKDSATLIDNWHGKDRLLYALTPRFAPTSTPEQFAALAELAQQYPDVFVQTHLSENKHEIDWVKQLYPNFKHYLDVYDHYQLVRKRAVFGHCLHLHQHEWDLMHDKQASAAFCPTSNLFLGSGLFDLQQADKYQVDVILATDVGAGTSFNMLRTQGEAYKVCQLQGTRLSPLRGLYMMTQGAASALDLEHKIGNLNVGSEADFVVLDPAFNVLTDLRTQQHISDQGIESPQDVVFALTMLADERCVSATYVAGEQAYKK